ncbi:unnamed protein product [Schistosoma margrebowiei]|uniref:Uncharacterized protein n=1 Tax=Schistosoma margrebowiei TaxID=48269 RepID=A0A183M4K2_9TREM|nr:unnamed protein product [Schistosoma margrebowiei]
MEDNWENFIKVLTSTCQSTCRMHENKQAKRSIGAEKQKYAEDLAMTAEIVAREGNVKQPYDTTKKLAGKYSKLEKPVKDNEGKTITEIQGKSNRWVEYFEELLNRPAH